MRRLREAALLAGLAGCTAEDPVSAELTDDLTARWTPRSLLLDDGATTCVVTERSTEGTSRSWTWRHTRDGRPIERLGYPGEERLGWVRTWTDGGRASTVRLVRRAWTAPRTSSRASGTSTRRAPTSPTG